MKKTKLIMGVFLMAILTACGNASGESDAIGKESGTAIVESNETKSAEESTEKADQGSTEEADQGSTKEADQGSAEEADQGSTEETSETASYTAWGEWSDWSETAVTASETVNVETQIRYRYRDNTPTQVWGAWSEWQDAAVSATGTRQVETRQVDDPNSPIYKTQYRYDRWAENSDGWGHNGPVKGTWGGVYCQYHIYSDWMDEPLEVVNVQHSTQVGGNFNNYGSWYNEETRQVETGEYDQKTQYRYQDLKTQDVWGAWSAWSADAVTASATRQVEQKTFYRYKTRSKETDQTWGEWSAWQEEAVQKSATRQVETISVDEEGNIVSKTQYQYDRWAENSDGWGHNGPVKGTWGGVYCQYHIYSDWMDEPLEVVNIQYSTQMGGYFYNYGSWYNETTRVVETDSVAAKKLYRYRDLQTGDSAK